MAVIEPYAFPDPGFHWCAGLLHWTNMGPDSDQTWHIIGYSLGPDEIPFGGYDCLMEFAIEDNARRLAELWQALPITIAVACPWCRDWNYGPLLWKPNAFRGENRGPRSAVWCQQFPNWPTAVWAGHIIVWPDV